MRAIKVYKGEGAAHYTMTTSIQKSEVDKKSYFYARAVGFLLKYSELTSNKGQWDK